MVDLDAGRTIAIPLPSTEGQSNTDTLVIAPTLRYGLSSKLEVSIRGSGTLQQLRTQQGQQTNSNTDTRWNDLWFGTQYQIFNNHPDYPNLLAFAELAALQRGENLDTAYAESGLFGITTYTINDPLVFSLTNSYQFSGTRKFTDGRTLKQGDVWSLSGSIGFAVNPEVTLTSGAAWRQQQSEQLNGQSSGMRRTQTSASLGFAYAVSERSNLSFNLSNPISGNSGSTLSLQMTRKLGTLPDSRVSAIRERARQRVAKQAGQSNAQPIASEATGAEVDTP